MKQAKPYQNIRSDRNSIINLEKGKIPPQAIDLEEVVLGAMMIDKKGVDEVIDILNSEAFYKEGHQYIFDAILTLFENSEPIENKRIHKMNCLFTLFSTLSFSIIIA